MTTFEIIVTVIAAIVGGGLTFFKLYMPKTEEETPPVTAPPIPANNIPKVLANVPKPVKISAATNQPAPKDVPPPPVKYLFDLPQNSRHSARVIMDEEGLTYATMEVGNRVYKVKDVLCACIEIESQFYNILPNGNPVRNDNFRLNKDDTLYRDGEGNVVLLSSDWGICQINDTKGWHIGKGLTFSSVEDVLAHPDRAVRFMARMYKVGNLKLWASYTNGEFKKHLPQ